jgi:hypothetical protein
MPGTSSAKTRFALLPGHDELANSVLGLVDQRALLDPRHHVAEFFADFLDRMGRELGAGGLERGLVDLVLESAEPLLLLRARFRPLA